MMDTEARGVPVTQVTKGMPAERAGIRPGDEIITVNGARVRTLDDYVRAASRLPFTCTVRRGSRILELEVRDLTDTQ